jgi:hypothetical protein
MKLITLRISEDEKARLEQLAEAGDITLSRALREGARLYLTERRGKLHQALGGETTFHGIRRDKSGRTLTPASDPTKGEAAAVRALRHEMQGRALRAIREAWDQGADGSVVLAATGHWLDLIGELYVSSPDETGWDWFLRDYCGGFDDPAVRAKLREQIRGALVSEPSLDVAALLDTLDGGMTRLLRDAERQYLVRRAILATWKVMAERLGQ